MHVGHFRGFSNCVPRASRWRPMLPSIHEGRTESEHWLASSDGSCNSRSGKRKKGTPRSKPPHLKRQDSLQGDGTMHPSQRRQPTPRQRACLAATGVHPSRWDPADLFLKIRCCHATRWPLDPGPIALLHRSAHPHKPVGLSWHLLALRKSAKTHLDSPASDAWPLLLIQQECHDACPIT